ncbi:gastrula zinc finger protein XlCGF7.1-like [Ostrinia nubilalis]|uniref:gastrula zinc finger protein XlCGF7.1-like n=1 Tax=Ostrinia nubilalis TaxID=29057 RepID=UPI003082294D
MDKCGICDKPAVQLFETGNDGVYACFKCQPLVPEVTIDDSATDPPDPSESQNSNTDEESNDKSLYCGICHKSFQKSMQLQNHMRNHRAERRFVCTYCNKAFSQSNNLRAHLRIHTNERPFKCTECGKAFTQVTNLNNHVRLHTGERPFVCPEPGCNKAYAQVTNLNQHRKRHLNGRPVEATYDCTVCGEQFQQRNHMYTHRREAHPEVRSHGQRCGICDAILPSERLLRLHVAQHTVAAPVHDADQDSSQYR